MGFDAEEEEMRPVSTHCMFRDSGYHLNLYIGKHQTNVDGNTKCGQIIHYQCPSKEVSQEGYVYQSTHVCGSDSLCAHLC